MSKQLKPKSLTKDEWVEAKEAYSSMSAREFRDWERRQFMADIKMTDFQQFVLDTLLTAEDSVEMYRVVE